jgi:hypothetical protein
VRHGKIKFACSSFQSASCGENHERTVTPAAAVSLREEAGADVEYRNLCASRDHVSTVSDALRADHQSMLTDSVQPVTARSNLTRGRSCRTCKRSQSFLDGNKISRSKHEFRGGLENKQRTLICFCSWHRNVSGLCSGRVGRLFSGPVYLFERKWRFSDSCWNIESKPTQANINFGPTARTLVRLHAPITCPAMSFLTQILSSSPTLYPSVSIAPLRFCLLTTYD